MKNIEQEILKQQLSCYKMVNGLLSITYVTGIVWIAYQLFLAIF